jgi:hypothetical protein
MTIKGCDVSDKNNNKKRRPSDRTRRAGSALDPAKPKRRRQRLPVLAVLSLNDALAANEYHPLAKSAPEVRAASRLRLIATVLARLATNRRSAA